MWRSAIFQAAVLVLGCSSASTVDPVNEPRAATPSRWDLVPSGTAVDLVAVGPGLGLGSPNLFAEGDHNAVLLEHQDGSWGLAHLPHGYCVTCKHPGFASFPGESFAIVSDAVVQHTDKNGVTSAAPTGAPGTLRALWGPDAAHLYAVGDGGAIAVYDGGAWVVVTSPTQADLRAVWGRSAGDVFAVGDGGTIVHFDGQAWSIEPTPTTARLNDVGGRDADAFAVGAGGVILQRRN